MNTKNLYQTMTFNHDFGFKEYITPAGDFDPKKQRVQRELADYRKRRPQGKFKVTTKPKKCWFDEIAKLTSEVPGASKYKVEGNMIRRSKSDSIKKIVVDLKASKKTYLDDITAEVTKHKPPGVGKFDLTRYTDIGTKGHSSVKNLTERVKFNNFDDGIKVAAELPGPGQFNPHVNVL